MRIGRSRNSVDQRELGEHNILDKWISFIVNRNYLKKDVKHTTKVIAVICDDQRKARLEEPVVQNVMRSGDLAAELISPAEELFDDKRAYV